MIREEIIQHAENVFVVRHYSDLGYKIRQIETGKLYEDAVDVYPCIYTYEETNEPIPDSESDAEEALNILLGDE